jgi:hypothetical protein
LLCIAIRRRVLVKLLYGADPAEVLFEPTVLYLSSTQELSVGGVPIADAAKAYDELEILEVCKIAGVSLTERDFVINPRINRFAAAYALGIVCLAASAC